MSTAQTLLSFASLQNDTSATSDLNQNFTTINAALANTLALNGQSPNQMQSALDMNSNPILNLPVPVSNFSPARLIDITSLGSGGSITVNPLPTGGTAGQVLTKNSSTNFDVSWQTPSVSVLSGKSVSFLNTLTFVGTDATTITFQGSDTYVGRATTDTFFNKTINFAASGNVLQINGNTIPGVTGSGVMVLQNTPTINSATLAGTINGTPTFSGPNFISFSNLPQIGGFSLAGNIGSVTGNMQGFTIGSLTLKASPATTDLVLIQDQAASGALKYATIGTVGTAGSVSSIAGNTGAFTLGLGVTNATNAIILDASFHRGAIGGLTLSNDGTTPTTVIDVSAGFACDDTAAYMMKLSSNYTKSISSTWTVGSGNGAMDTGTFTASTWYHVYIIARTDTGVVDVLVSASATSPTMPTNYTVKRRIGSIRANASAQISTFTQFGEKFLWAADDNGNSPFFSGTVGAAQSVTATVPTGVKVEAIINAQFTGGVASTQNALISSLDQNDQTPAGDINLSTNGTTATDGSQFIIRTNTSGQIRIRTTSSSSTLFMTTPGWFDYRGKYS